MEDVEYVVEEEVDAEEALEVTWDAWVVGECRVVAALATPTTPTALKPPTNFETTTSTATVVIIFNISTTTPTTTTTTTVIISI